MKAAILGAGTIVPDFLEAAAEVKNLEVAGVFGREKSAEKLRSLQEKYQIPRVFYDYDALLGESDIDTIYIALPNDLHHPFAKKALLAGKHVVVEKPFASSLRHARELVDLAQERGLVLLEAISNQYTKNYQKTRQLLPKLGKIRIVSLNFTQYSRRYDLFRKGVVLPVFDPKKSGGALMDLGVYNIHFAVGLFGAPKDVWYAANIQKGVDTSGILTLSYEGFQCVCVVAKDCRGSSSILICGEEGCLQSHGPANSYDSFTLSRPGTEPRPFSLNAGKPRLYYELQAAADMIDKRDLPAAQARNRHSLEVMRVLDLARRQAGIFV